MQTFGLAIETRVAYLHLSSGNTDDSNQSAKPNAAKSTLGDDTRRAAAMKHTIARMSNTNVSINHLNCSDEGNNGVIAHLRRTDAVPA